MRILYLGTGDIGVPTLEWLLQAPEHTVCGVVTQPDKPAGRKLELLASPIKVLAHAHGLPVLQPPRLRAPGALEPLRALAPEALVVMAYGQILPKELLQLPPVACLNLHASLLPRHRGAAPIQAAIEAGDEESGVTVMYMDEGLDTGPVLLQRRFALPPDETGGSLHQRLGQSAPGALAEALQLLAAGEAPSTPQMAERATHAPKLSREHGLLEWSRPAVELERKVRALNPWPSAYTWLSGEGGAPARKLKVFASGVVGDAQGEPGTVLAGGLVATGAGALQLQEVQLEGKKRMPAVDFLRGCPLPPGTRLSTP